MAPMFSTIGLAVKARQSITIPNAHSTPVQQQNLQVVSTTYAAVPNLLLEGTHHSLPFTLSKAELSKHPDERTSLLLLT